MTLKKIIKAIQTDKVNITNHARIEAKNNQLLLDEIYNSTKNGEIIEYYLEDKPFPSCLIFGKSQDGEPVHSVWAYDFETEIAILITVYRPDADLWINWKERKKS